MSSPLIGIVADRRSVTAGPWRDIENDGLPHTYVRAVEHAGGIPLLIPSIPASIAAVPRLIASIDGLFLAGGRDLDALLYDDDIHLENDRALRVRDDLEIALIVAARAAGLPVFGACRGLQAINVALGGTLEQHIGDHVDLALHRGVVGTFTEHDVEAVPGTLLARVVGTARFPVASHHHQAIGELAPGLVASATATDGIIEAAEATDGSFCLGVQWHPEEGLNADGLSLLSAFIATASEGIHAEVRP